MSAFEFIFSLFGLLLGLSLTEVLGGLGRSIDARLRPDVNLRIGWLTPLLAIFVILDLLSFWAAAWVNRDIVGVSGESLLAVTCFASAYYLAAFLVFPRQVDTVTDLDAHFFRVRRIVIGVMFALLIAQLAWYSYVPELAAKLHQPLPLALTGILMALMGLAMITKSELWTRVAMLALVGRYVIVYLL